MIYLCTTQQELFESNNYKVISAKDAIAMMQGWKCIQFDSEEDGRDPHLCKVLSAQFGNDEADTQIVVDTTTVDLALFKDLLESKLLIGQNLKFDLQFLYNYGIIPRKVYDTMIVEQLLHLGYPSGQISYSLQAIAERRLGIYIDKTVRGEIQWRGLDESVILYGAGDVTHLEKIKASQMEDLKKQDLVKAAFIETQTVPAVAYLEWCGIHLDADKWKAKMGEDQRKLKEAEAKLNDFVVRTPVLSKYCYIERQGDLFNGFDTTPKVKINWASSIQVVPVVKLLGFDTKVQDKKTGEDKDTVLEKHLKTQKGINDEFLQLYFDYQEHFKTTTSFGQGHLNAINPVTDRIHTVYRQLGASSGRFSCGSQQANSDLAKYKGLNSKSCTYPNMQQLPSDAVTRGAFTAPKGYKMVSADFSAEESRLAADIYQDKEFYKEFTEGSGDTHSMFAWAVFRKECEALGCTCVGDVKEKAPKWRKAVKAVEFAYLFGAAAHTISQAAQCSVEQAQEYIDAMDKEFSGVSSFAKKGSEFVRKNGYILMCKHTGHKMYWWDYDEWLKRQKSFTSEFWEDYRNNHKGTGDAVAQMVRKHSRAASKYDRMARNSVTQGTGAVIMKSAMTSLFNWIVDSGYFSKIHICASVHDEIVCDFPEELSSFPKTLEKIMEEAAALYCKSLPIPADAAVSDHWVH